MAEGRVLIPRNKLSTSRFGTRRVGAPIDLMSIECTFSSVIKKKLKVAYANPSEPQGRNSLELRRREEEKNCSIAVVSGTLSGN